MTTHDFDCRESGSRSVAQAGSANCTDTPIDGMDTLESDERCLASVSRELDAGSATVAAAALALEERGGIQSEISALLDQLRGIAFAAETNGTNLLVRPRGVNSHVPIVAALARGTSGEITASAIDIDRSVTALFGDTGQDVHSPRGILDKAPGNIASRLGGGAISGLSDTPRDQELLDRYVMQVDEAIIGVKSARSHLSIARSRINLQASFINSLTDAADAEPAAPVASDLDLDAARRTAIETGRLLRGQPRSIASLNSQTVLKLFRRP